MKEYKFYGGNRVNIDGEKVRINVVVDKEELLKTEIIAVTISQPKALSNGEIRVQTRKHYNNPLIIHFLKKQADDANEVYRILSEDTNVEDESELAKKTENLKSINKNDAYCPSCGSNNFQVMGNNRKGFSVGKAIGGTILVGGIGTLAGFAGKKGKYDCLCNECGKRFKMK